MEKIRGNWEPAKGKVKSPVSVIWDILTVLGMIILFGFIAGLSEWYIDKQSKYAEIGRKYMRGELTIQDKMYGSERE